MRSLREQTRKQRIIQSHCRHETFRDSQPVDRQPPAPPPLLNSSFFIKRQFIYQDAGHDHAIFTPPRQILRLIENHVAFNDSEFRAHPRSRRATISPGVYTAWTPTERTKAGSRHLLPPAPQVTGDASVNSKPKRKCSAG